MMAKIPDYPIDKADKWYLFELMHGASLLNSMFDNVCAAGEGYPAEVDDETGKIIIQEKKSLFEKYPDLNEAYVRALNALSNFYQVCGAHQVED